MPFQSKYDPEHITKLSSDMLALLTKEKVPVDLALMVLGNVLSNVVNDNVPAGRRSELVKQFAKTLEQSVVSGHH
ncbi:DUF1414 domain-containing protein [Gallaecimonas pentaromativorans]|uniref:Uncharacterized protein n=1 Tax=Gallaecimonas pentaromativorans TaxID=584787 RepID=A0A3N1P8C9_9GAMM|nr:DUF1414 domain-containing protein [Gallaecimonas pentaromativorans]MED5525340.1 DUF1414 domain-containing protein [Pseudomonadota bacterium]ROQ27612.1 hypothetical protein EDC28_104263 [Gallaecimonas pentaromativorans]